jgi:hypothetical protein
MDPWFNATLLYEVDDWGFLWGTPLVTTVIGCTEQYQFCNGGRCTPMLGLYDMNKSVGAIGYNPSQHATFRLLWKALWSAQLRHLLIILGSDVLLANEKLYTSLHKISLVLPPNQWHTEMENLHNISMAIMQRRVVDHALPSKLKFHSFLDEKQHIVLENDTESLRLCHSQRIKTSTYSSFSVLGLAIIIFGGLSLMLLNILLADVVAYYQRNTRRGLYQRLEWIETETLQLQRMVFEGRGIGPWEGLQEAVPITSTFGQKFHCGSSTSALEDRPYHVDMV